MVGVYFSGATAPTCLYSVPTLTPKRRGYAESSMGPGAERSTSAENQTDPLPGFNTN